MGYVTRSCIGSKIFFGGDGVRRKHEDAAFISRTEIIRRAAKECNYFQKDVAVMYSALEKVLVDLMVEAPDGYNTVIAIFDGISLYLQPKGEYEMFMPMLGETRTVTPRLKIKAERSGYLEKKVNELRDDYLAKQAYLQEKNGGA